jgi:hypothetical protein
MPSIKIRDEIRVRDELGRCGIGDHVCAESLEVRDGDLGRPDNALQHLGERLWRVALSTRALMVGSLRKAPG